MSEPNETPVVPRLSISKKEFEKKLREISAYVKSWPSSRETEEETERRRERERQAGENE